MSLRKQVHFWITDPPYASDVNYAELSEFFLAWDQKLLKKAFPHFKTTSGRNQAVEYNFLDKMRNIIAEMKRTLHDKGNILFFFASNKEKDWDNFRESIIYNQLTLVNFWAITTEPNQSMRKGNRYNISMMLVLSKEETKKTDFKIDELIDLKLKEHIFLTSKSDINNIKYCCRIMTNDN